MLLLFGIGLCLGSRLYRSTRWGCVGAAMVCVAGGEGIVCVMMGLLAGGSLGSLAALIDLFVGRGSLGYLCVVLEWCFCFISQNRKLASVDCPIRWLLCGAP